MKDQRTLAEKLAALANDDAATAHERETARAKLARLETRTAPPAQPPRAPVAVGGTWYEGANGFAWSVTATSGTTGTSTFVSFH